MSERKKYRREHIELPHHARRDFIKWSLGLGAALGLRPWKVFEVTESIVGPAVAAEATSSPVNRSVHNVMGAGGFAWMTQLFPPVEIANKPGASFYATGQARMQEGSDSPFAFAPDGPTLAGKKMTAFVAGSNETHTLRPISASTVGTGVSLFAAVAAMQTASPTLVPSIAVTNLPYGSAAGAPMVASVAGAGGMVDLFNSAAASAGGALADPRDAALFEAYYKANLGLHRAAARPTMTPGLLTGKVAANLLGKNLGSQLMPTPADFERYGISSTVPQTLQTIAASLITTFKAFKLNLTSSVMLPGTADDPHGAFADMAGLRVMVQQMSKIWDAFMADMMSEQDPLTAGSKMGDNLVVTWSGDTPKDPLVPNVWPDSPSGGGDYNILYVMGNGHLKTGWVGEIKGNGQVLNWDPASGKNTTPIGSGSVAQMAGPAGAAVLYAIGKRDDRRVSDFFRGDYSGIVTPKTM